METTQPLWVTGSGVDHCHSEDVLSHVQEETSVFQFVPAASCPLAGQHCEDSDFVFFASSHEVSVHIDKIFLRHFQAEQSLLSQLFHE